MDFLNYTIPPVQDTAETESIRIVNTTTCVLALVSIGFSYLLSKSSDSSQAKFWRSTPISGTRNEYFSWIRATLRSVFGSKAMVDAGYATHSRQNAIFATPSIDRGAFVVIPPEHLKSVYALPESKVDVHWAQAETIQASYTIGNPEIFQKNFHVNVIRNQITRSLDYLTKGIVEELKTGFDSHWGSDGQWKSVAAWGSCLRIVAESANRVFVGSEHCRDEAFLEGMKWHGEWVFSNATLINAMPAFLRPVIGSVVWLYGKRVRSKCITPMLPLIKQRLADFLEHKANPNAPFDAPKDGLQWLIEESYKANDPKYLDPWRIGHRILILNFVSMHTTSFTVTNTIQDLFSRDSAIGTVDDLRDECTRVLQEAGGEWTKDAVSKLHLLDSTIRESMRFSSFSILALPRRVVAQEGITLSDDTHIPSGIPLATPMDAIHFDSNFYSDPSNFHPFRFCQSAHTQGTRTERYYSEQIAAGKMARGCTDDSVSTSKSTVTLDDKFLAFGFGRNACPGRFFALHEMKLMLAYALMNYDIEFTKKRPEQFKIMWVQLPHDNTKFRVRKRT